MALIEKQGHLGDLHIKSITELEELLKRQEKLVSNPVIVKRLPDKGSKIFAFIEKIKEALTQLENIDRTADLFEKMAIQSEHSRQQRLGLDEKPNDKHDEMLHQLAERGNEVKIVIDERKSGDVINGSETIFQKADKLPSKYKFRPNRTIRSKDVHSMMDTRTLGTLRRNVVSKEAVTSDGDIEWKCQNKDIVNLENDQRLPAILDATKPDRYSNENKDSNFESHPDGRGSSKEHSAQKPPTSGLSRDPVLRLVPKSKPAADITEARGKLRYRYDESLETQIYTGIAHCQKAQMIMINESVNLLESQQKSVQELQAKYAADKLAERLHIKMDEYQSEGQASLSYRDQDAASDSDDEETDYPD